MFKFHRRLDGAAILVNPEFVMKVFPGRYGKGDGTVLKFGEGTEEVRESIEEIEAVLARKQK